MFHIWPIKLTLFTCCTYRTYAKIPILPLEGLAAASRVSIPTLSAAADPESGGNA